MQKVLRHSNSLHLRSCLMSSAAKERKKKKDRWASRLPNKNKALCGPSILLFLQCFSKHCKNKLHPNYSQLFCLPSDTTASYILILLIWRRARTGIQPWAPFQEASTNVSFFIPYYRVFQTFMDFKNQQYMQSKWNPLNIFNVWCGEFPKKMKLAKGSVLYMDRNSLSIYRLLLPIFSKGLEKLILCPLDRFFVKHTLYFPSLSWSFRKGRSIESALLLQKEVNNTENKLLTLGISIGTAFDCINHQILADKPLWHSCFITFTFVFIFRRT